MTRGRGNNRRRPARAGPSTAGLELPAGYTPPHLRNAAATPEVVAAVKVPKPWEIDSNYPKPSDNRSKLSFNYNRPWASYGVKPEEVEDELTRDLTRGRRLHNLPHILRGATQEQLAVARVAYKEAGELDLFKTRCKSVNQNGFTRLFLASPLADYDQPRTRFPNEMNALVQLLRLPELANPIICLLMPSVRDISALAASCKDAAISVTGNIEIWNSTTGEFDFDRFRDYKDKDGNVIAENKGIRSNVLCIASSKVEHIRTYKPYEEGWVVLGKFVKGVLETKNSYRDVIIDQLPFFDARLFEMMLQSMPNLETVAISRCLLLDVTKLKPMMEAIARHPRILPSGEKKYIRLDFSPYYFEGPNDVKRYGSFGVTHNEPTFNISKAVVGLLTNSLEKAKRIGMDLTSDSSSFWRFITRLPGPDTLWAVKVRDAMHEYYSKKPETLPHHQLVPLRNRFADDLTAAVMGDGIAPLPPPPRVQNRTGRRNRYGHWRNQRECTKCQKVTFESFLSLQLTRCWTCEMVDFVDKMEDSHFRHRLRGILDCRLKDIDYKKAGFDTVKAVPKAQVELAYSYVVDTDMAWHYHLEFPTGTWKGDKPPYPELPPYLSTTNSTIRRLRQMLNKTPALDFRFGGPQYIHPLRVAEWPRELFTLDGVRDELIGPLPYGSEDYTGFYKRWQWTERTDNYLRTQLNWFCVTRFAPDDRETHQEKVERYLREARTKPMQIEFARYLEWICQSKVDGEQSILLKGFVEDNIFAHLGRDDRNYKTRPWGVYANRLGGSLDEWVTHYGHEEDRFNYGYAQNQA